MKRIFTVMLLVAVLAVPVHAQTQDLKQKIAKSAGEAVGAAVLNKISKSIEKKAASTVENVLGAFTSVADSSAIADSPLGGVNSFGGLLNAITGGLGNTAAAGQAPLRDFSQQNAARKEHNKELVFDNWD